MTSRRTLLSAALVSAALAAVPSAASAHEPKLRWSPCGDAGAECATARVPLDYDKPHGRTLDVAVTRVKATNPQRRIGSLFFNFGGPGAPAAVYVEAFGADLFPTLSDRFDIVGIDPRGTGDSEGAIDCQVDQETEGVYSQPFETPLNLDVGDMIRKDRRYIERCLQMSDTSLLPHFTTADTARDFDFVRRALGERRLSYLGFSYGTFLGATYASLFPDRYRALVLDGALDADRYINRPLLSLREQTAGFERAAGRFLQACAANQAACSGFGGEDPWMALDELIERAEAAPLPAAQGRPVDGDDVRAAVSTAIYSKFAWPALGAALAAGEDGNGTPLRDLVDGFYLRNPDGSHDPLLDRYFNLGALEQRYPRDLRTYLEAGDHSWGLFDHFWWNHGYVELAWGLYPIDPQDAYYGPFKASRRAPTALVIGTTYDPATPYRGSVRLTRDLGNARLLTMRGDGHTAYGGNSECIDEAVDAYLEDGVVPAPGTTCRQMVPFEPPAAVSARSRRSEVVIRPHTRPLR